MSREKTDSLAGLTAEQRDLVDRMISDAAAKAVTAAEINRGETELLTRASERESRGLQPEWGRFRYVGEEGIALPNPCTAGDQSIDERIRCDGKHVARPLDEFGRIAMSPNAVDERFPGERRAQADFFIPEADPDEPSLQDRIRYAQAAAPVSRAEAERAATERELALNAEQTRVLDQKRRQLQEELASNSASVDLARRARDEFLSAQPEKRRAALVEDRQPTRQPASEKPESELDEEGKLARDFHAGRVTQTELILITEQIRKGQTFDEAKKAVRKTRSSTERWDPRKGRMVPERMV